MSRDRALELVLVALLLVTAGALRLRDLDRFIASDELRWTCRSINFHAALDEGRWADTFQVGHPGVVTMWLGAAALPLEDAGPWRELCRTTDGGSDLSDLDNVGMEGTLQTVAPRLFAARRGVAVGTLVALAALYALLRAGVGLGVPAALGGVGLLALDPFLVAHSRVLHLDAIVAVLSALAVTAFVAATRPRPGRQVLHWHALAGALAGLAILNKSSALVLGPAAVLGYAWWGWRTGAWRPAARGLALWLVAAGAAVALLWPAMWVAPLATVTEVLAKATAEGGQPHASGNFFMGRPVADPGPAFYAVAAPFRLTPWGVLGVGAALALALGWGARGADRAEGDEPDEPDVAVRRLVSALVAWAVLFGLVVTLGPKKFDRYLLPALAALNLAGGIAVAALAARFAGDRADRARVVTGALALAVGLLALQAVEAARSHPYALTYYNPLLGGARVARQVLLVGWGEGYDLAAGYLNGLPGAETLEASAPGVANFAPLFAGRTRSAPGFRPGRTDYVVLELSKVQRRRDEELLVAYHDPPEVEPAFVGAIAGIDVVWVYANRSVAPVRAAIDDLARPGDVLVAGGETVLSRRYDGPLPLVPYWGHWGPDEIREAVAADFPADWNRAWVVRYPEDPDAVLRVLADVAEKGETQVLEDGLVEITSFERWAP